MKWLQSFGAGHWPHRYLSGVAFIYIITLVFSAVAVALNLYYASVFPSKNLERLSCQFEKVDEQICKYSVATKETTGLVLTIRSHLIFSFRVFCLGPVFSAQTHKYNSLTTAHKNKSHFFWYLRSHSHGLNIFIIGLRDKI